MGQLLNRIFNFVRANVNDAVSPGDPYATEDGELKKIIDELNREKKENRESGRSRKRTESSESKGPGTSDSAMNNDKACKVLGIDPRSGVEEIKSAYKQKIKEYHPDRVANLGDEIRELAGRKTQEINQAYNFLKNERNF